MFYFSISIKIALYCVTSNSFMLPTKEVGFGWESRLKQKNTITSKTEALNDQLLFYTLISYHNTLLKAHHSYWERQGENYRGKYSTHLTSEILALKFIHELH